MTYQEALALVRTEFETLRMAPHCEVIRTNRTLDGCHSFPITLYDRGDEIILNDLGETKEVFDEVEPTEWQELCESHGFQFDHWRIIRPFKGMQDLYDFIEFLNFIADRFDPLDEDY